MIALNTQLLLLPAPSPEPDPAPDPATLTEVDPALAVAARLIGLWLMSNKSDATRQTYRSALQDFSDAVGAESPAHAVAKLLASGKGPATATVEMYRAALLESRKLAPATVNLRVAAVRSLLVKAYDLDLIGWLPRVKGVRSETLKDTRGPGAAKINEMYGLLASRHDAKGARDRLVLRLLWDLALRRNEVASLDVEHVDLEKGVVWIKAKGHRERSWVTLPEPTRVALADWLTHRGTWPGPLLIGLSNRTYRQRLTGNSLHAVVALLGKRVGVTVWPHAFRHSSITSALDATNGDVRTVRLFSRHASLDVLTKYDDARQDVAGKVGASVAAMVGS